MTAVVHDNFFAENWKYLLAALVLHLAIGAMLTMSMNAKRQTVMPGTLAIKATVVDHSAQRIKREKEKVEAERLAREQADAEQKAREQAEAEQKQREQEKAELEAKRQQQLVADKKRKADEQQHQAAVKKQSAADEKKRVEEIKNKQAEKQKAEREARDQALRQNELKRLLADEDSRTQAENAGLLNQWVALVQQSMIRNWNRPPSAHPGIQCDVKVTQATDGTVLSVKVDKCNGDQAVRESIEAAVFHSSPLPPPPDPHLFQRVIVFVFKPSD